MIKVSSGGRHPEHSDKKLILDTGEGDRTRLNSHFLHPELEPQVLDVSALTPARQKVLQSLPVGGERTQVLRTIFRNQGIVQQRSVCAVQEEEEVELPHTADPHWERERQCSSTERILFWRSSSPRVEIFFLFLFSA